MRKQFSTRSSLFLAVILLFNLVFVLEGWAEVDDYPNRPVEIIVGFAAGQSNDLSSRALAPYLQKYFNQPFLVVNKPGAGGKLGYTYVATSKPDGYTMISMNAVFSVAFFASPDLKYNLESFIPICLYSKFNTYFVVRGDSPWKTLEEFIADAKKKSGQIELEHSGIRHPRPFLWTRLDQESRKLTLPLSLTKVGGRH